MITISIWIKINTCVSIERIYWQGQTVSVVVTFVGILVDEYFYQVCLGLWDRSSNCFWVLFIHCKNWIFIPVPQWRLRHGPKTYVATVIRRLKWIGSTDFNFNFITFNKVKGVDIHFIINKAVIPTYFIVQNFIAIGKISHISKISWANGVGFIFYIWQGLQIHRVSWIIAHPSRNWSYQKVHHTKDIGSPRWWRTICLEFICVKPIPTSDLMVGRIWRKRLGIAEIYIQIHIIRIMKWFKIKVEAWTMCDIHQPKIGWIMISIRTVFGAHPANGINIRLKNSWQY